MRRSNIGTTKSDEEPDCASTRGSISSRTRGQYGPESSVITTGFVLGAIAGATGGLAGGLISGTGNDLLNGKSVGTSLRSGLREGLSGLAVGGVLGGITGGIQAALKGRNFWTGSMKTIKIPNAYYVDVNTTSGNMYDPNAFGADVPYVQNYSGHRVHYRTEGGAMGLRDFLEHGRVLSDPVDGIATFKSTITDKVYKIPDGGKVSVIGGGEVVSTNAKNGLIPDFGIPLTRWQFGWQPRSFFISHGFYGGEGGWRQLFDMIPNIR